MIRHADIKDLDAVIQLLVNFANAAPVSYYHNPAYNTQHLIKKLAEINKQGLILVAEVDNQLAGMLIAAECADPWLPQIKYMRELAWWVEPLHRNSTVGYRLLKQYEKICKNLVEQGRIKTFIITTLCDSAIRDLSKHGWRAIEQNYMYQGAK